MLGTADEASTARLRAELAEETVPEPDQIAASLVECVSALREGRTPMCEVLTAGRGAGASPGPHAQN